MACMHCCTRLLQKKPEKEHGEIITANLDQLPTESETVSTMGGGRDDSFCNSYSEASPDDSGFSTTASSPCSHLPASSSHMILQLGMSRHNQTDEQHVIQQLSEFHIVKERFSKMLLGQDMSGSGKGVSSAVAVSNSITDLYASVFGQHLRLEPLHHDKKLIWQIEMNCLNSICDQIVEFIPTTRNLNDGCVLEVMTCRPRSDICINLPALKKLDSMLMETLDSLAEREFWYVEQQSISENSTYARSVRRTLTPLRKERNWWLPIPCVPPGGLSEFSRKHLQDMHIHSNQIHKAAKALNCSILAEMNIPESYISSLPKKGKAMVGDTIYHYLSTMEEFRPDIILNHFTLSSEHEVLGLADKIEASICIWSRKACGAHSKSSWDVVKHLVSDIDRLEKNRVLAERAETLLYCLKQKYPQLSQTSLDVSKIKHNMDVGKAIQESYSRVMECLAFNIMACIDDVLLIDKTARYEEGRK